MKWLLALLICLITQASLAIRPAWTDSAEENYTAYCARCHGDTGHGDGPSMVTLKTKPQDLSDCARLQRISDDTMFSAIKNGGASVGISDDMPNWSADLNDDEIHDLVKFIRSFCKKR